MVRHVLPNKFSRRSRLTLIVLAGMTVSATAIWALTRMVDLEAAWGVLAGVKLSHLAGAILTLGFSMVIRTMRWHAVLPSSGLGPPPVLRLVPLVIIGYAANALAPLRLGDAARGVLAARRFKMGVPETLGSVGLERLIDAIALALLLLVASIGTAVPDWFTQAGLLVVAATLTVLATVWLLGSKAPRVSPDVDVKLSWRVIRGLRSHNRGVVASFGWSLAAWAVDGITFWLCAQAVGIEIGVAGALLIAGGAALGSVAPSAPAAVGTFELAGTAVAIALGLGAAEALALVALAHAVTVVPIVVAGIVAMGSLGLRARDVRRMAELADGTQARVSSTGAAS